MSVAAATATEKDTKRRSSRHQRMTRRWHVRRFTSLRRVAGCGRWDTGALDGVTLRKQPEGDGCYYNGVQHCGSVWACPTCQATIGQRRAAELAEAMQRWLDDGHGAHFVTLTIPHTKRTPLRRSLDAVAKAWTRSLTGRHWMSTRKAFGIVGYVRTLEATYGEANGWHPHIHAVFFTDKVLGPDAQANLYATMFTRWQAAVQNVAGLTPHANGFKAEPVQQGTALGQYLIKLGLELHRGDLKQGKRGDRHTPTSILDEAATGTPWALVRWKEWEKATFRRRFMTWGVGTRATLGITAPEKTDEELAAEMQGGDIVAHIDAYLWHKITSHPGADADLLAVAEQDGAPGVLDWLRHVRLIT